MPLTLGPAWETTVLQKAGIDPTLIDPGTLDVSPPNPGGRTTIRATIVASIDTDDLRQTIRDALTDQ